MKKLFSHSEKSIPEWEDYGENNYDWDSAEEEFDMEPYGLEGETGDDFEDYGPDESLQEDFEYYESDENLESDIDYDDLSETVETDAGYYESEENFEDYTGYYEAEEQESVGEYDDFEENLGTASGYYGFEEVVGEVEKYSETAGNGGGYSYAEKPRKRERGKVSEETFLEKIGKFIHSMDTMDKVMVATGVGVLILALITGSVFISASITNRQVSDFADVGMQLDGISLIGEEGLLAVADAQMAKIAAASMVADEPEEEESKAGYEEKGYERQVAVQPNFTSIQKDLKIKFINKKTEKLVANVPFSVTVTGPDGKSHIWSDDDMDGIIYKKDITPGTYQVAMEALTDAKYADYVISTASQSVEVQKEIAYKKVNVANEVKQESEINVAKEDTKKNETVVESSLQDTVAWVESKVIDAAYETVDKSSIPDPLTLVLGRGALYMTAESGEPSSSGSPDASDIPTSTPTPTPEPISTPTPTPEETPTPTTEATTPPPTPEPSPVVKPTIELKEQDKSLTIYPQTSADIIPTINNSLSQGTLTASSSDEGKATVSVNGNTITVTGVAEGTAEITISYTESSNNAICNVTVKKHPKDDKTTLLEDASGRQVYVMENNKYREATRADYYTASKFYVLSGEAKYTGWQTLDGKVYYYTAEGKKVTGEQVIQGAKYNFASDGSLVVGSGTMGIDVSKWNGSIDWNAVKNSGVSYVIIRCGYRGSSEGKLIVDPKFESNIKGATGAGLKVGIYFFSQAVDEIEAVEEASMVLDQIRNYKISYPVFLDVETSGGRGDRIDKSIRTSVCKAFCQTIQNAGYTAGVYSNKTWLEGRIDAGSLSAYKIWLAQYAATPTYKGRYDLWQYRSTGSVSGISGKVDMNISYLGY